MAIPHEKTIRVRHGRQHVSYLFQAPHQLLATLLETETGSLARILQELGNAAAGLQSGASFSGNVCTLMIGQEMSVLLDSLAADGIGKAAAVPTADLILLIEEWLTDREMI